MFSCSAGTRETLEVQFTGLSARPIAAACPAPAGTAAAAQCVARDCCTHTGVAVGLDAWTTSSAQPGRIPQCGCSRGGAHQHDAGAMCDTMGGSSCMQAGCVYR